MKHETINQFYEHLKNQNHESTTIAGYI